MKKRAIVIFGTALVAAGLLCACSKGSSSSSTSSTVNSSNSGNDSEGVVDEVLKTVGRTALAQSADFHEDIVGTVGDHIYYSSNLFDSRKYSSDEKKAMLEYLETVDASLTEDLYVTGYSDGGSTGDQRFYARQYINGAVVSDVYYATDWDKTSPNIVLASDAQPVADLDTSNVISPEVLFPIVKEEAEKNSDKLNDYNNKGVYGFYLLSYESAGNRLVYDFTVNEFSHVKFDAVTGDLVSEDFWNGAIAD
jgi:hypothetical protein